MLIPHVEISLRESSGSLADVIERLCWCGKVRLVPVDDGATDDAKTIIKKDWGKILWKYRCMVGPMSCALADEVTEWLNNGALQVCLKGSIEEVVATASQFPIERVSALIEDDSLYSAQDIAVLGECVSTVVIKCPADQIGDLEGFGKKVADRFGSTFRSGISVLVEGDGDDKSELAGKLHHLIKSDHPVHVESKSIRFPKVESLASGMFDVGQSFISCLRTDRPDGLFTTVVTDEFGVALGLVYSSNDSIIASLENGRGVYWSRSRNSLWRKGDTSGAFQELIAMDFDCDADAIRFKVRQRGEPPSFCHLETRTCWGEDGGLPALFRTLESRKKTAPDGSYTKRLFEDKKLLQNKLLEESQEVMEAIEEQDEHHVAEETADLAYFLFTACCSGNASLEDVCDQLDMRSLKIKRRPGNAKQYRIDAAAAMMNGTNSNQ